MIVTLTPGQVFFPFSRAFQITLHGISLEIYQGALTIEAPFLAVLYIDKVQFYLEKQLFDLKV